MKDQLKLAGYLDSEDQYSNSVNEPSSAYGVQIIQFNPMEHAILSNNGLPISTLSKISQRYKLTNSSIASIFEISEKTLHNRLKKADTLKIHETDLALSLIELYSEGRLTFEKEDAFISWLNTSWEALQFQKPIDLMKSVSGVRFLIEELRNIREGIFA